MKIMYTKKIVEAVIFDLDGTLTDTEKYYQMAWPKAIEYYGYEAQDWMPLELRSLGRPFVIEKFIEWFGEDFDYTKVREYRKKLVEELVKEHGIPLKPGVRQILTWLKEHGIMTALATANDFERTKHYLTKIGLFDYFDKIICADMVEYGKPAPDIYIHACKQLNIAPNMTFAVEDSPNGVRSAYEAGCKVIMVPDLTEPDEELMMLLYTKVDTLLDIQKLCFDNI